MALGSLNQRLELSYNALSTQVFTELGYKIPLGDVYVLEPFAGVAWNQIRTRDFQESGGTGALHGGSTDDVTSTTLGLRGAMLIGSDSAPGRLTDTLGWRHARGDVKPTQKLAFEGGSRFSVSGIPIARGGSAGAERRSGYPGEYDGWRCVQRAVRRRQPLAGEDVQADDAVLGWFRRGSGRWSSV